MAPSPLRLSTPARSPWVRSPLKWAGGKTRVLPTLVPVLEALPLGPKGRFIEPFAGSLTVLLNLPAVPSVVCDKNAVLMNFYAALKAHGASFVSSLEPLFTPSGNTREVFDGLRAEFNASHDPERRAQIFIYLNKHAFNGLYRENSKGVFNVPFGRFELVSFPRDELLHLAERLRHVTLAPTGDFERLVDEAQAGDVVYCDPAYVPLSDTSNFTSYGADGFDFDDQFRLARAAERAALRGASVVISNHDTELSRDLYARAEIMNFNIQRSISRAGAERRKAPELLAIYRPSESVAEAEPFGSRMKIKAARSKTPSKAKATP